MFFSLVGLPFESSNSFLGQFSSHFCEAPNFLNVCDLPQ